MREAVFAEAGDLLYFTQVRHDFTNQDKSEPEQFSEPDLAATQKEKHVRSSTSCLFALYFILLACSGFSADCWPYNLP